MRKPFFIIGNWKSNKTVEEATIWMQDFTTLWKKSPLDTTNVTAILCPAYIHLTTLTSMIKQQNLPIHLGLQDISPYGNGTYTGAISAEMVKGLVEYVIIGHSERRTYFNETETILAEKLKQAKQTGLKTIYCVQEVDTPIPNEVDIIAYEPPNAISKGNPYKTQAQNPEQVNQVSSLIKQKNLSPKPTIYGGSTTPENVMSYFSQSNIDGVLPGGASLKPDLFFDLLKNVCSS